MKFSKILLLLIIPLVVVALFGSNISSVSTVLLAIKGTITDGNLIKFSGTAGVGEDAGITSANVEDAITKKHSQNTDTALGTLTADVNMGTHKLTGLSAPSSSGDSIRATAKITEANLESAIDHKALTDDPHSVTKTQVGLGNVENLKVKLDATQAPTVNNDVDEGYAVGSYWLDVTNDKGYVCLDKTDGAAVWIEITSLGTTTFTGLTDTPANYTGEGGKYVKVNVGEDALEFGTVAGEANTASNVGSEVEIYKQKTGVDLELRTLKAESNKITISTTPEASIDIGSAAIDRAATAGVDNTWVNKTNPANDTGTITKIEIWANTELSNCEVATFSEGAANWLTTRDNEAIGTVTAGSKQTFDVNLTVQTGDYIGIYFTAGAVELDTSGYTAIWYATGDQIPCSDVNFGIAAGQTMSVWGDDTGASLDYIKFDIVPSEIAKEIGGLLSATTVAFNADADTTLYTVPTGKRCVLSHAMVVAAGDAGATTTVSIGQNTAETDFVPANTLSNLDAEYDSVILMPIPNTTPLKIKSYAADTVIEAQVASQSGVAGNTIYLFGILY